MLNVEKTHQGALRLSFTDDDARDDFGATLADGWPRADAWMREALEPNGRLYFVPPENIGALTDAPILTDDLDMSADDPGEWAPREGAGVWWFPNYALTDPWDLLAQQGVVIFDRAP